AGVRVPAERDVRQRLRGELRSAHDLGHRRDDGAERDGVDADAIAGPFARRAHGNPEHARLGGAVVDLADGAARAGDRRNVDDLAVAHAGLAALGPLHHVPADRLQAEIDAGEVDVDDLVPLFARHPVDHRRANDARNAEVTVAPTPYPPPFS